VKNLFLSNMTASTSTSFLISRCLLSTSTVMAERGFLTWWSGWEPQSPAAPVIPAAVTAATAVIRVACNRQHTTRRSRALVVSSGENLLIHKVNPPFRGKLLSSFFVCFLLRIAVSISYPGTGHIGFLDWL
jgi:hypothetical protein